ncbi:pyridoxal phosphate-dependent transferase [Schizophyllum amplum]|uniref:histidinol-phosphate transaminase n=1 Tax=Schizophyllum amplum TaxID=97359 RepID=A0A550C6C6_9AGAR|nr:pyridoxal phosphate-dependent transferase [Auriculariopsis ampla]
MPIHGLPLNFDPIKPAHFNIEHVIRPNILALHPYRCARDDYQEASSSTRTRTRSGTPFPPRALPPSPKSCRIRSLEPAPLPRPLAPCNQGPHRCAAWPPWRRPRLPRVGSDEVMICSCAYASRRAREDLDDAADVRDVRGVRAGERCGVVKVPLRLTNENGEGGEKGRFSVDVDKIKKTVAADPSIKLIFLCSPGNPTGTSIALSAVRELLEYEPFKGIVVVDEAYVDFAGDGTSAVSLVSEYANVCVLQTLSKSFGLAAIRLGIAIAQPPLMQVLFNTKAPYNISTPAAHLALAALSDSALAAMREKVARLIASREKLLDALAGLADVGLGPAIGGNDANFVMVRVLSKDGSAQADNVRSEAVYKTMAEEHGVVVRFRGKEAGCEGCLRVTVGTEEENAMLVKKLREVLTLL